MGFSFNPEPIYAAQQHGVTLGIEDLAALGGEGSGDRPIHLSRGWGQPLHDA